MANTSTTIPTCIHCHLPLLVPELKALLPVLGPNATPKQKEGYYAAKDYLLYLQDFAQNFAEVEILPVAMAVAGHLDRKIVWTWKPFWRAVAKVVWEVLEEWCEDMDGEEDEEKENLFWKMKNGEGDVGDMLGRMLEEMSLGDGDGDGEAGDEMEDEEMEEDEMEE